MLEETDEGQSSENSGSDTVEEHGGGNSDSPAICWAISIENKKGEEVYSVGLLREEDSILLGRSSECDITIRHSGVSRQHCCIELDRKRWKVEDLDSTNGIIIKNNRETSGSFDGAGTFRIGNWNVNVRPISMEPEDDAWFPTSIPGRIGLFLLFFLTVGGLALAFYMGSFPFKNSNDLQKQASRKNAVKQTPVEKVEEPVSLEEISSLHNQHRHDRAHRLLVSQRPPFAGTKSEKKQHRWQRLKNDLDQFRKHRKRIYSSFEELSHSFEQLQEMGVKKKRDSCQRIFQKLNSFLEEHTWFLWLHPEITAPETKKNLLSYARKLRDRINKVWIASFKSDLKEARTLVNRAIRRAYFAKALRIASRMKEVTAGSPAASKGKQILTKARKEIEKHLEKNLEVVRQYADSGRTDAAMSLVRVLRGQFEGTDYTSDVKEAVAYVKNPSQRKREKLKKRQGPDLREKRRSHGKPKITRRADRRLYERFLREERANRDAFKFGKEAAFFRRNKDKFHTKLYKRIVRTRINVYRRLEKIVSAIVRWINNGSQWVKEIRTETNVLRPVRASREQIVVDGNRTRLKKTWEEMSDLSFLMKFIRYDSLRKESRFGFILMRMERGEFGIASKELVSFWKRHPAYRDKISRYIAMRRQQEIPPGGYVPFQDTWVSKSKRKRLRNVEKEIGSHSPELIWNIPEEGSALYAWEKKKHGYWLHGNEMKAERPDIQTIRGYQDVPVYLSMILPGRKVRLNREYSIHRRFKTSLGLLPQMIVVRGRWTGIQKIKGETTLVLKHTVKVLEGGMDPTPDRNDRMTERLIEGGRVESTLYYDPKKKILRRIRINCSMVFNHLPRDVEKKSARRGLYSLTARYDLKEFNKGTTGRPVAKKGSFPWKVKQAIDKAVHYLKNRQRKDGSWQDIYGNRYPSGETALVMLALLESGVKRTDPVIKKAMEYMQKQTFSHTYSVALSIMAVERLFTPEKEHKKEGSFVRGESKEFKPARRDLSREAENWMIRAVSWLLKNMNRNGTWSYGQENPQGQIGKDIITSGEGGVVLYRKNGNNNRQRFDHSNTQYAMLGLHAAARCGIFVHRRHWIRILKHWLNSQEEKGPKVTLNINGFGENDDQSGVGGIRAHARSWGYTGRGSSRHESMTPVGIASVKIARHNLKLMRGIPGSLQKHSLQAIYDGLAWIQKNYGRYSLNSPPRGRDGWADFYDMYSIERCMMLNLIQKIGGKNWYRQGAQQLIRAQSEKGSWGGSRGIRGRRGGNDRDIVETCFALLFLKRATIPTGGIDTGH